MVCPKCGHSQIFDFVECPKCGYKWQTKVETTQSSAGVSITVDETVSLRSLPYWTNAIEFLKIFAWLDLIASIVSAIWIWIHFSKTTVLTGQLNLSVEEVSNPVGVLIGIGVLLQGMFSCAFLLVVAAIAENLIAIRKNTTLKNELN